MKSAEFGHTTFGAARVHISTTEPIHTHGTCRLEEEAFAQEIKIIQVVKGISPE